MDRDNYGRVSFTASEIFRALYSGKISSLDDVFLSDEEEKNKLLSAIKLNYDDSVKLAIYKDLELSITDFDRLLQKNWFMPDNYCPDLIEFLYSKCKTDIEKSRVIEELKLFTEHNMFDLLFYLKYLVDTMREHNIVWGVGRGSSVSSYILYLIGVHKIDSIKYDLDIKEFLR